MIGLAKVPRGSGVVAGVLLLGLAILPGCGRSASGRQDSAAEPGGSDASPVATPNAAARPAAGVPDLQSTDRGHGASSGEGGAREPVSIPAATVIPVVMESTLSTGMHTASDTFYARVAEEILAPDGMVLVPEGARMSGRLVEISPASPTVETSSVSLTFESLEIDGATTPLDAVAHIESAGDLTESKPTALLEDGQAVVPEGTRLLVRLRSPSVLMGR